MTFIQIDMNDCVNRIIRSDEFSLIFVKIDMNDYVKEILQKLHDFLTILNVKYGSFCC